MRRHVACMREIRNTYKMLVSNLNERVHMLYVDVDGRRS
jgi:hypothetical protein